MHFQWFPGHMTKAIRAMQDSLKLIDIVIELVDARIPISSRNPEIDKLAGSKSRIILLNKCDMADERETARWISGYEKLGFPALAIDARNKKDIQSVASLIEKTGEEKRKRDLKRGIKNRPVRTMVVGIPNVGKSTFINSFVGKASAKTGNRPGVTKGNQWIKLDKCRPGAQIELLDTPGILWPKFEDQTVGLHLAWIGAIRDERIINTDLALDLIEYLESDHKGMIEDKYGFTPDSDPVRVLTQLASVRKCVTRGGEPDHDKAAFFLLDDFRNAGLGRITIEEHKEELV